MFFAAAAVLIGFAEPAAAKSFDRDAVIAAIIQESIADYSGSCPCPYNTDRAGHSCGRRSAYSKPGGYAPICYPQDVTDQMIQDYEVRHQ